MPKLPLKFPIGGLHEGNSYSEQPPNTSSDVLNVRSRDAIKDRQRGGRRPGLSKWIESRVNGVNTIQAMAKVAQAKEIEALIAEEILISHAPNTESPPIHFHGLSSAGAEVFDHGDTATEPDTVNQAAKNEAGNYYLAGVRDTGTPRQAWKLNSSETLQWESNLGANHGQQIAFDEANSRVIVANTRNTAWPSSGGANAGVFSLLDTDGSIDWAFDVGTTPIAMVVDRQGNVFVAGARNTAWTGASGANATVWKLSSAGALLATYDTGSTSGANIVGTLALSRDDNEVLVSISSESTTWQGNDGTTKNIFVLSNTLDPTPVDTYSKDEGDDDDTFLFAAFDDVGNIVTAREPDRLIVTLFNRAGVDQWTQDFGDSGVAKGIVSQRNGDIIVTCNRSSGYTGFSGTELSVFSFDKTDGSVNWTFDTGAGSTPVDNSLSIQRGIGEEEIGTRETSLIVIAGGSARKILAGSITIPLPLAQNTFTTRSFSVQMVSAFNDVFIVDGNVSKYLDLATDTMKDWATDITAGSLPAKARLIASYRGRVVIAGIQTDPHNWHMSKVADAFDFDTAPGTPTAIQAVSGNIGEVGQLADIITALVPFADDAMIFGGDQSIWQLSGDPAAGGSFDLISDEVGMAWNAWTKDPNGVLYFMGIDGIYRLEVGQKPVNITESRLDSRFEAIDLASQRVILAWDFRRKGLTVVVADTETAVAVDAFFYSARDDEWELDAYPAAFGPDVLATYDAEEAEDKALLFGCRDGHIRQVDPLALDDDGIGITSRVRYQPVSPEGGVRDGRLLGVTVVLAENSGPVDLKVYVGQTAEQCALSTTVRFKRVLTAGRNVVDTRRLRAPWIQIELGQISASTRWAVETAHLDIGPGGKSRRHRR